MFERFTEAALRSLFLARAKCAERDGRDITPEDILHGILIAAPETVRQLAPNADAFPWWPQESVDEWMERVLDHEPVHSRASVEVPFVPEVKLALERALEEANVIASYGLSICWLCYFATRAPRRGAP
jgi:hypothetical protein